MHPTSLLGKTYKKLTLFSNCFFQCMCLMSSQHHHPPPSPPCPASPEEGQPCAPTCLETLSQVFFRRKMALRLREEVISSTAL